MDTGDTLPAVRMKRRGVLALAALGVTPRVARGADGTRLRAGAGRAAIALGPELFPFDRFTSAHDDLGARVLLLETPQSRAAIVVLDLTSLSDETIAAAKAVIAQVAGIGPGDTMVIASHTFSAPHAAPMAHRRPGQGPAADRLNAAITAAIQQAAIMAQAGLRPARVAAGTGPCDVNVNRDVETDAGWWLGVNPADPSDKSIGVVRFEDESGQPIALLVNAAVQPSVLNGVAERGGGKVVSADLAGAAMRVAEARMGHGAVALFLVGAAGDQAPNPGPVGPPATLEAGYAEIDRLGQILGAAASDMPVRAAVQPGTQALAVVRGTVPVEGIVSRGGALPPGPQREHAYVPDAPTTVPWVVMRIGDVAIVGVQAELSASTGIAIRTASPFGTTLVVTMVDGAAKYMPDAASYDRITYEALSTRYAKGSAETVAGAIGAELGRLHAG